MFEALIEFEAEKLAHAQLEALRMRQQGSKFFLSDNSVRVIDYLLPACLTLLS